MTNPATNSCDAYKSFHRKAEHPAIVRSYGNFTNRNGRLSNVKDNTAVANIGWQFVVSKHLINRWNKTFFRVDKATAVARYTVLTSAVLGRPVEAPELEALHDLGFLPIRMKALPEGTMVPYQVASMTYEVTVDGFGWLQGMLETVISQEIWPIQTTATTAFAYLKNQKKYMLQAGMDLDLLPFMIHDFSARGMFGEEASAMSGFAHLAVGNFGSDTYAAAWFAEEYYGADLAKDFVMASVSATEHSVTCGWMDEGEEVFFKHLMEVVAPEGILAVVSDTWDFWHTVTVIAANLKDNILARDGKLVFRPDSGDPVDILCGLNIKTVYGDPSDFNQWKAYVADEMNDVFCTNLDAEDPHQSEQTTYRFGGKVYDVTYEPDLNRHDKQYYYVDNMGADVDQCTFVERELTPEDKGLIECLWDTFGGTTTAKGYRILDEHVGAIYGDAITLDRQQAIAERLMAKGFAPQVVLGVGSFSYQYVTRDTHGSAIKSTNVTKQLDGKRWDQAIAKDPKTDSKKKSAKGLLRVELENGEYVMYDQQTREQEQQGALRIIFENGVSYNTVTLDGLRASFAACM